jgi:hypothetical protein
MNQPAVGSIDAPIIDTARRHAYRSCVCLVSDPPIRHICHPRVHAVLDRRTLLLFSVPAARLGHNAAQTGPVAAARTRLCLPWSPALE